MLIGDLVCLGPLLEADGPVLFNWLNDRRLALSNGPFRPMDQAKFAGWFGGAGADPTRVIFAIRDRRDMRLMGYVQVINLQPVHRNAELGILIGAAGDRDRGVGQEAMRLALGFCWRDLNLHRVALFRVGDDIRGVAHVYLKVGFEKG